MARLRGAGPHATSCSSRCEDLLERCFRVGMGPSREPGRWPLTFPSPSEISFWRGDAGSWSSRGHGASCCQVGCLAGRTPLQRRATEMPSLEPLPAPSCVRGGAGSPSGAQSPASSCHSPKGSVSQNAQGPPLGLAAQLLRLYVREVQVVCVRHLSTCPSYRKAKSRESRLGFAFQAFSAALVPRALQLGPCSLVGSGLGLRLGAWARGSGWD